MFLYAMVCLPIVMTALFGLIMLRFHRRTVEALAIHDWLTAGEAMNSIRALVQINLVLGFVTVAVAVLGG